LLATMEMCEMYINCEYFPAYELVFSNALGINPFDTDGRSVKKMIVDFVMEKFFNHFGIDNAGIPLINKVESNSQDLLAKIIQRECEEQQLAE